MELLATKFNYTEITNSRNRLIEFKIFIDNRLRGKLRCCLCFLRKRYLFLGEEDPNFPLICSERSERIYFI